MTDHLICGSPIRIAARSHRIFRLDCLLLAGRRFKLGRLTKMESFHQYLFPHLGDPTQRGRLVGALLHRVTTGDWEPNRQTVAALVLAGLAWTLEPLAVAFQEYTGGELVDVVALMPAPE